MFPQISLCVLLNYGLLHNLKKKKKLSKILIWYLEMDSGHEILQARRMECEFQNLWQDFWIYMLELKLQCFEVFPYVCIGNPCICNVFCPRVTWAGVAFTLFAQNCIIGSALALYCSIMHCSLSFAVLHTEKLAFQCATLLSWEEGLWQSGLWLHLYLLLIRQMSDHTEVWLDIAKCWPDV